MNILMNEISLVRMIPLNSEINKRLDKSLNLDCSAVCCCLQHLHQILKICRNPGSSCFNRKYLDSDYFFANLKLLFGELLFLIAIQRSYAGNDDDGEETLGYRYYFAKYLCLVAT